MALSIKGQMLRFTKLLKKVVEDTASPKIMKAVGEETKRLVQQQAKLGNDYKTGGKFKSLSDQYIDKRNEYRSDLHARTRPKKSNVTATGQMVDSLKVSEIKARSVELEVSGSRSGGSPFDSGRQSNAEVAYYVEKNGRHWLGLSDKMRARIIKFYDRLVKAALRDAQR